MTVAENLDPGTQNQGPGTQDQTYSYRNLLLWQKAQDLALQVIRVVSSLPKDPAAQIIVRQIIAASASVAANIAEGHGRFTLPAHRNHLSIAKGSACETDGWLDLLQKAGYIDPAAEERLHQECEAIIRMLTAKIIQLERMEKAKPRRLGEEMSLYTPRDYAGDRF